ncbi:MAG: nucleotide sugar dehydrogenase, partial [Chloroflexia bacterium]
MARISVIGMGYVGLVTAACFADLGNEVWCVELDGHKIELLRQNKAPFYEPGLEELIARNATAGRLRFTTRYEEAIPDSDFVFICVGTPMAENGAAELKYVRMAAESIGPNLRGYTIIVNKSTVPIGTGDMVTDILSRYADPDDFAVVSNPEFLREGSAVNDFFNPDRIVLGAGDRAAAEKVAELHAPLNAPVIITDLHTAEMIKYASNAFLATRISFI